MSFGLGFLLPVDSLAVVSGLGKALLEPRVELHEGVNDVL